MDKFELLFNQIKEISSQNERDHEQINSKMDQMLTEIHVLFNERNVNEKRFDTLEQGQKDLKIELDSVQKKLQNLQDQNLKRQHGWSLFGKVLAGIATVAGIVTALWKFNFFG